MTSRRKLCKRWCRQVTQSRNSKNPDWPSSGIWTAEWGTPCRGTAGGHIWQYSRSDSASRNFLWSRQWSSGRILAVWDSSNRICIWAGTLPRSLHGTTSDSKGQHPVQQQFSSEEPQRTIIFFFNFYILKLWEKESSIFLRKYSGSSNYSFKYILGAVNIW